LRALRRAAKRFVARIAAWLLGGSRPPRRLTGPPERILVLRIDERVGNVLLTSPLFAALRAAFPNARIDALVAASKVSLVENVVETIPFEKRDVFRRPLRFVRLMFALRRRAYDVVIDASHWHHFSATSAALLAWTGGGLRIAHDRGQADRFATNAIPPPAGVESEVATKIRLLAPLLNAPPCPPMSTPLGREGPARAKMDAWLEAAGSGPFVGLAPGARKPDHRVDPSVFARLGVAAREAGATPLVLWGPGELELAERVASGCDGIVAPDTNLDELAALMRRCAAVVTNDTGPMHLSVACGAATVALFLRADPNRWGHATPPHAVMACDGLDPDVIVARAAPLLVERLTRPPRA
jgi:heptosyltransferase-3